MRPVPNESLRMRLQAYYRAKLKRELRRAGIHFHPYTATSALEAIVAMIRSKP